VDGGITVNSAKQLNATTVQLRTTDQTLGKAYSLGVSNFKDLSGNTIVKTNISFNAVNAVTGFVHHLFFIPMAISNPDDVMKDPRYPNNPTTETFEPLFEWPPNAGNGADVNEENNYGNELSGWLLAPTTGDYVFYLSSDDQSNLYLSTDGDPANKKLIAQETQWSDSRHWTTSNGPSDVPSKTSDQFPGSQWPTKNKITLQSGKRYYIQILHHDGTGGDSAGVAWQKPGDPVPNDGDEPIPGSAIVQFVGAGSFTDFALKSVTGSSDFLHTTVNFTFGLDPSSATNLANYSIPGLTITGATLSPDGKSVTLNSSKQAGGTTYNLSVSNVKDILGRSLPANSGGSFAAYVLAKGGVIQKFFANISSATLDALRADDRFPDNPSSTTIEPLFEYPPNAGNEAGSNYGNTMSGLFVPPSDGDYVFFVTSDDQSDLFLSTDEDPANKKLIAQETAWSNPRQFTASGGGSDLPTKRSDQFTGTEWPSGNTITLSASKKYYIEVQHVEGGGGDNVAVAFSKAGASDPTTPIDGSLIMNYLPPASVTITQQPPATVTAVQSKTATFSVGVGTTGLVAYQWQKAAAGGQFADISGATGSSYTTPLLTLADNNSKYRVIVNGVGSSATSNESVLTVTPDTTAPTVLSGFRAFGNPNNVLVKFSEPLGASANTAGNFKINGTAATGATLGSDLQTVTLTFGSAVSSNASLAISGVSDLAGNAVAGNTSVTVAQQKGVLFVTADPGPLTFTGDQAVAQHLADRGFAVVLARGSDVPDDGSTANGTDLIVQSSSLASSTTVAAAGGSKFKELAIPLLEWEASNADDLGFASANGTTVTGSTINIVDPTSPLAAGFPAGTVTVVTSPQTISVGSPGAGDPVGAHIVANTGDPNQPVIYDYEKGDKGFDGFTMPERRVFFFFQDTTAAAANDNGWKLFDAAVDWALHTQSNTGGGGGNPPNASITISGNSITVSSDNGGTVQATDSLSPANWQDVGPAPQTVQIGSTNARFFRIKK